MKDTLNVDTILVGPRMDLWLREFTKEVAGLYDNIMGIKVVVKSYLPPDRAIMTDSRGSIVAIIAPNKQMLKGYLCHCVSYMPETSIYLEGTDAGACKMLLKQIIEDMLAERIALSDIRAMRHDQELPTKGTNK